MNLPAYLIDTHVFLWLLTDPGKVSARATAAVTDGRATVWLSTAAAWEMVIKSGKGRLTMPEALPVVMSRKRFDALPVRLDHVLAVAELESHHADPFDRLMIAQARIENLTFITRDPEILKYDVRTLEA